MRISDWSSDVCSSDLQRERARVVVQVAAQRAAVAAGIQPQFVHQVIARAGNRDGLLAVARVEDLDLAGAARLQQGAARQAVDAMRILAPVGDRRMRSEEHTSELQSLMRISYAV